MAGKKQARKANGRKRSGTQPRDELARLTVQQKADDTSDVRAIGLPLDDSDGSEVTTVARRHDGNYQPANTTVLPDGYIVTQVRVDNSPLTNIDRRALATVLNFFGSIVLEELEYREGETPHDDLVRRGKVNKAAVRFAKRHETWPYHALTKAQVYGTYEAITGCKPGEEWKKALADELRAQAALRETDRLRRARGLPTDPFDQLYLDRMNADRFPNAPEFTREEFSAVQGFLHDVKSPEQILESVKSKCGSLVPPWLNVGTIEEALNQVNLGGKGGRGKAGRTPEGSVAYISNLYANRAKPKK